MLIIKEELFKAVGAKIVYYRMLKRMSRLELSIASNISKSSIAKIERGYYNDNVSLSILSDIAMGLDIDLTLLFTFNEQEKRLWMREKKEDS